MSANTDDVLTPSTDAIEEPSATEEQSASAVVDQDDSAAKALAASAEAARSAEAEADDAALAAAMGGADFEASLQEPTEGDVISGVIVHIDKEGILVDVGAKSEGLVRPNEISRSAADDEELIVGQTIKVVVIGRDKEDGKLLLSKKRADFEKAWDKVIEALEDGRILSAMVTERVKGGLVVDLGIRGFVPASHVGTGDFKHTNLDKYVGQSVPLKVIEVDRDKRKVVLSNKLATEEERGKKKKETLDALKEGDIREGVVRRVTDYGAFIDLGGIDGLLHVSEMSWARINHPSEVVKVGDKLQVMILKLRLDQGRISLGLRQILPDPWEGIADKYHVADVLKTTISRLVPFGAFVLLEGGVEAIIPNSELSTRRISKPQDVVNPGDEIEARIIEIKPEERKMTLSIRRIQEEAQRAAGEAAREQEYREFQNYSKKRSAPTSGVTLGDVLSEQFARARKEVSRKSKRDKNDYDVEDDE
ncbi:MAG: 30S ribosomal protein S1 [Capsulimonadaceae bacterium]|nr:30S ribosomal protein S1 [Capsulimonadaceae bacterium]